MHMFNPLICIIKLQIEVPTLSLSEMLRYTFSFSGLGSFSVFLIAYGEFEKAH